MGRLKILLSTVSLCESEGVRFWPGFLFLLDRDMMEDYVEFAYGVE
jgi:hypothetical protein